VTGPTARRDSTRNDAVRLLLTPRWILLSLLLVGLTIAFAVASSWQYQRAIDQVNAERAAASVPQPVAELVPDDQGVPASSLGRLADVEGSYVADAWVPGRASVAGEPGVWLVSALDDGSGLLTAVLRGWLPQRGAVPGPTEVAVTGRVSSPENFYQSVSPPGPDELVAITDEGLADIWRQPTRSGYVVLVEQQPAPGEGGPEPVPAVFGTDADVGFPWQNAGYALQWLFFIAFAGFMYWRLFTDDLQRSRQRSDQAPASRTSAADVP
jgi:surfeit locus 1 family protein